MASKRWTYKVVNIKPQFTGMKPEQIETALNQLGSQGWELVSIKMTGFLTVAVLKKET